MKQAITYSILKSFRNAVRVASVLSLLFLYASAFGQSACNVQFVGIASATNADSIHFYPTSINTELKYYWSFGDGSYSTQLEPWHNYAPGNYNACLMVSDSTPGKTPCSATWCDSVHAPAAPPTCNAHFEFYLGNNPDSIHFYQYNTASSTKFSWSFGDGNTSDYSNPWHFFTDTGLYTVCLLITDSTAGGTCRDYWCDTIHVAGLPKLNCNASFVNYPSTTYPDSIHFYPTGSNAASAKYYWNFGDGDTSTAFNPWHIYAPGNYLACLTVTDSGPNLVPCSAIYCDSVHVLRPAPPLCNANFQYYSLSNPDSVHFYAVTAANTTIYSWTFGDGHYSSSPDPWHFYADTGTYIVCLTVTDSSAGIKCTASHCDTIHIQGLPKPTCNAEFQFYYASTNPDSVHFYTSVPPNTANTTFYWSFGDGNHSDNPYPWHLYADTGKFNVCLTVTDSTAGGKCTATWCDTIHIAGKQNAPVCNAEFVYYPNTMNLDSIHFYPSTNNSSKISYSWSFGDGTYSSVFNPWHLYAPGNYNACLTIYDTISNTLICTNTWCDSVHIAGHIAPICSAEFRFYSGNNPDSVHFYPDTPNTVAHYLWTFGDGDSSHNVDPWHYYSDTGMYYVCLTVTDSTLGGTCKSTWCAWVHAPGLPKPTCNAEFYHYSLAGNPDSVHFYTNTNNVSPSTIFSWSFGDGASSSNPDPWHLYASAGAYYVCLTVTNSTAGGTCTATWCDTIHIIAPTPPACNAEFKYYSLNNPDSVHFYPVYPITGAQYLWTFGNGDSSRDEYPWHFYADTGYHLVCLTITDATIGGTCTNRWCNYIHIASPPPPCNAHFTYTSANSQNTVIHFIPAANLPGTTYLWYFGNGAYSTYSDPTCTFSTPGTYWVCLSVRDSTNSGICQETWCDSIHVGIDVMPCDAQFTYQYGSTPNTIYFIHVPNAPDVKYSWNFGDGTTSSDPDVLHQFANPGVYWVCLTVSDSAGTCRDQYCDSVHVIGGNLPAICNSNFYFKPGNVVHSLYFVSSSNPPSTKYLWTFGDGDSSTSPNPFHQYAAAGTYVVCLTVKDTVALCSDTRCLTIGPLRMANGGSTLDGQGSDAIASIYPNPITENAILHIQNAIGTVIFKMYDDLGRLINIMGNLSNGDYNLSKEGLAAGVYLYEVIDSNSNVSRGKLIVE